VDSVYLVGNFKAPDLLSIINGSYLVDRDFFALIPLVHDPQGNQAYATACGRVYVETRKCLCSKHRGARDLPVTEFMGSGDTCIGCARNLAALEGETVRSMKLKARPTAYWKALRSEPDRRRKQPVQMNANPTLT
jgi:hypothetical protein